MTCCKLNLSQPLPYLQLGAALRWSGIHACQKIGKLRRKSGNPSEEYV
jgi:hypothetical protein